MCSLWLLDNLSDIDNFYYCTNVPYLCVFRVIWLLLLLFYISYFLWCALFGTFRSTSLNHCILCFCLFNLPWLVFWLVRFSDLPLNNGWVGSLAFFTETDKVLLVTYIVLLSALGAEVTEVMLGLVIHTWPLPWSWTPLVRRVGRLSCSSFSPDTAVLDFKPS